MPHPYYRQGHAHIDIYTEQRLCDMCVLEYELTRYLACIEHQCMDAYHTSTVEVSLWKYREAILQGMSAEGPPSHTATGPTAAHHTHEHSGGLIRFPTSGVVWLRRRGWTRWTSVSARTRSRWSPTA